MRDYLTLGPTPCDEACAQVGSDDYPERSRAECKRYLTLLRTLYGPEPEGAALVVKSFPHDFGTYREVCVVYDDDNPRAAEYAYLLERNLPTTWDAERQDTPECDVLRLSNADD
jgi:hypothetical protein